jgi:hypothetical protein
MKMPALNGVPLPHPAGRDAVENLRQALVGTPDKRGRAMALWGMGVMLGPILCSPCSTTPSEPKTA